MSTINCKVFVSDLKTQRPHAKINYKHKHNVYQHQLNPEKMACKKRTDNYEFTEER